MADGLVFAFLVLFASVLIFKWWNKPGMCSCDRRMDGHTVIVTGSNCGMGKATAADLAGRGARVIMACRSLERGSKAAEDIHKKDNDAKLIVHELDLASFRSIRAFCKHILSTEQRLDVIVNNAAVLFCPKILTADGYEYHFGINYLGHFLMTNLLLELLRKTPESRVVNVTSFMHRYSSLDFNDLNSEKSYNRFAAYMQSKLANILFSRELSLREKNVRAYSVNPGSVHTSISHRYLVPDFFKSITDILMRMSIKTPFQGAQTAIHCSVSRNLESANGCYFSDCKQLDPSKDGMDERQAKKLWEISETLAGLV